MTELKAVLFDLDDTLFSTTQFARRARANAVRAMVETGLALPEAEVMRELEEVIAEFTSNYEHHFNQLLRRLRPKCLERVNEAIIVAAGVVAYHDTKFRELAPFPDVYPLLEALGGAGIRRGVITHGLTIKQAEKLIRLNLLPHLDPQAIFISEQIGISKPNPKLWSLAAKDLGLDPMEVMYVGDSPEHDVAPPRSIGMITVWARRASKRSLEGTGIEPDHVVDDFDQLLGILRSRYGLPV
ncbi:MAG: TIGR02253 family HAD-type hydrolase [Planctomycetota bacterium]